MCGIFGGLNLSLETAYAGTNALRHRGPDAMKVIESDGFTLGHTRLAIQDLSIASTQPYMFGRICLAYNGELYNAPEIRALCHASGVTFLTDGDTEVVAAALDLWGADALPRLNGMFALAWTEGDGQLRLSRDRFGELPLHIVRTGQRVVFTSELKALSAVGIPTEAAHMLEPGRVYRVTPEASQIYADRWHTPDLTPLDLTREQAAPLLRDLLLTGTQRRAISDVPVCTLLSGGIDSAIIAAALKPIIPNLTAYTAVMDPKSPDLKAARLTAQALDLPLIEVVIPEPSPADLTLAVFHTEMPFKAQIEIAHPCLILAGAMKADGFKVTFSGEGSDELWASYGFSFHGLQNQDWHQYRAGLFYGQHRKNFARANKIFMAKGIECRLPFLDPEVAAFALGLRKDAVQGGKGQLKAVLQDAFRSDLPERIVRRPKMAFQDGLGLKKKAAEALADPQRYYRAEYARLYGGTP